ncbi:MAG: hypothetical protein BMS9Abin25_0608 [Gammaproteobacteria bacterium]|nr:MAG: hypothetical protein BMS9Abin25_0608 [Gammaproteobacteria bacterium]
MPYYVYRITDSAGGFVKQLELLDTFDNYREAKQLTKKTRLALDSSDTAQIKVMFAESELSAEEQLQEKREKPITMEWEK